MRNTIDSWRSPDNVSEQITPAPESVGSLRSAPTEDLPPGARAGGVRTRSRRRPGQFDAGDVFAGRYRILEMVGRGGFCQVYHAVDEETGQEVALKFLREGDDSSTVVSRMQRELRLARDLRHPNIVRLNELVEDDDRVCLVMEFVTGQTLKDEVRERAPLPIRHAVEILSDLASAVAAVHAAGIVHRDLKPQNVMVAPSGEIKLLDFGLARTSDSTGITVQGSILGTPDYMSPEQVNGGTADRRSDVYSLGVIAWELFAGRPPYVGETPISIAHQHVHSRVPEISSVRDGVPAWISTMIARMTDPQPDRRPSTAEEVLLELDRSSPGGALVEGRGRRVLAWILGIGLGAAAVSTAILVFLGVLDAPPHDPFADGVITVAVRSRVPVYGFTAERKLFLDNVADSIPASWSDPRIVHLEVNDEVFGDPETAASAGVEHLIEISFSNRTTGNTLPRAGLRVIGAGDRSVWWQTETSEELTLDYSAMVAASERLALMYQNRIAETFAALEPDQSDSH